MPISKSLSKLPSSNKVLYIKHSLNKSTSKFAPIFGQDQRFEKIRSFSPNKFYNIPIQRSMRSTSFGYGTKINFANKNVIDPGKYNISSTFNKNKINTPSFSIGRQEYYRGRSDNSLKNIAPGMYNVKLKNQGKFYMGKRIIIKQKVFPGPGEYNLNSTLKLKSNTKVQKFKNHRVKTQYDQDLRKNSLKCLFRQNPGPGQYEINPLKSISYLSKICISNGYKFSKQPRLKIKSNQPNIGPGSYQIFSEFSNPQNQF